jgi:hypothetical protein
MKRLNLGCGYVQPHDWVNVDKLDYGQSVKQDVLQGVDYVDEYFDFVLMNHTLQMFTYEELPIVLEEVRRVMKPSATLRILTPDVISKMYELFDPNELTESFEVPISRELERTQEGRLLRYIYWHGDTRSGFSYASLEDLLIRNGFNGVNLGKFGECELDSRKEESLILVCKK